MKTNDWLGRRLTTPVSTGNTHTTSNDRMGKLMTRRHSNVIWALLAGLVTICTLTVPCLAEVIGDPITNPMNGHLYYLLSENTWTAAEAEAVSLGGHLAAINGAGEQTWVYDTFSSLGGTNRYLWIGLTDEAVEGTFVWTTGEPVNYLNWASGEPNNGSSDYVYIASPADARPFSWNDIEISASLNAVAEVLPPRCCSFDSTNDVWDVSQGAALTASSGEGSGSLSNIFGAMLASPEPGVAFFRDDQAGDFVHFVEWQTPASVTVASISLRAAHDPISLHRAFKQFNVYAFNSAGGSNELILAFTPALPYGEGVLSNELMLCTNVLARTSDLFRAEFVQNGDSAFPGPRIYELDGFSELIPDPVTAECVLAPVDSTNQVGTLHTVTTTVTTNSSPAAGIVVNFEVTAGPNAGTTNSATTDASGQAGFAYTGQGGVGTDTITATGIVNCVEFSCSASNVWVAIDEQVHDFAILRMKVPKNINLSAATPALTKRVVVQIQNRSPHVESVSNFTGLVTVQLHSYSNACVGLEPVATLIVGPPNNPKTLKPKQKMNVFFEVQFTTNCIPNTAKGLGNEDYSYIARVHHEVLDGNADTHSICDVCPRGPLTDGDPNPDPNKPLKDKGCGNKDKTTGLLGADVKTDVFLKP